MNFIKHLKHNIKIFIKERRNIQSVYFKKSYSQSGEDLIVRFIFDRLSITHPSYLDIGAHDPFILSNTAIFYESGSNGINIEPDTLLFENFVNLRKNDINLNIGIGGKSSKMTFYIMSERALNTFSEYDALNSVKEGLKIEQKKEIDIRTLNEVLEEYYDNKFPDFLSLDAEGLDLEIMKSINYAKSKPKVICAETISFSKKGKGKKNKELINFILGKGYIIYADTNINTIFIQKEIWN